MCIRKKTQRELLMQHSMSLAELAYTEEYKRIYFPRFLGIFGVCADMRRQCVLGSPFLPCLFESLHRYDTRAFDNKECSKSWQVRLLINE